MEGKNRIIDDRIILRKPQRVLHFRWVNSPNNSYTKCPLKTHKMKKLKYLITSVLIVLSLHIQAQQKQFIEVPKVDKRVELLSIVFRLAGNEEYNATYFKKYTDKVESHFKQYKDHETIKFARELREKKGISYETVVNMAIILDDSLNPIIDLSTTLPEKWSKDESIKFVRLLKKFNKEAKCEEFFNDNEALFQEVAARFRLPYEKLDLNWFHTFYGNNADENFTIIISPGCGAHNYGTFYILPDAKKEVFAIMGTSKVDESGMPVYEQDEYLQTIIHEFNHSFVNQLLAKHRGSFEESGKGIYKAVEYEMSRQQAYGNWGIMLNEALVRASVIKYFIDHGASESEIQMMLNIESNKGFVWIKGLVAELKKYDNQRDTYPTLESYMPNLSNAYKTYEDKISQIDAQRPKVESLTEFANNDTSVNSQIKTITINLDRALSGKDYSADYGSKGKPAFPKFGEIYYTNDNKSVVMEVQLIPNQEYQFILTGRNFKTPEGMPLKTYEVNFKTTK